MLALSGTAGAWASTVVDLGNSGDHSLALFINNEGDVVGQTYSTSNKFLAFFYSGITQSTSILQPFLAGDDTVPTGLNQLGQVSGYGYTGNNNTAPNAFVYSGGSLINLESATNSNGFGLNDSGTVVGSVAGTGNTQAMVVTEASPTTWNTATPIGTLNGPFTAADYINNNAGTGSAGSGQVAGSTITLAYYLPNSGDTLSSAVSIGLTGATTSTATGINESGQVIGESNISGSATQHAFLYTPGTTPVMTDLGTLIQSGPNYVGSSEALATNDSGEVVGESEYASSPGVDSGHHEAFMYTGTTMTPLGLLPGYTDSVANAINDVGMIVGTDTNGSLSDAFIYMNGQLTDLNTLLPPLNPYFTKLLTATGINDDNGVYEVIGQGMTVSGAKDAYVLNISAANPTPEPSTMLTMALGLMLCAAGFIKRRPKR